ncbi:MAG: hypothetical protein QOE84_1586 [Actinomycetota bacterium]|jgi:hypothetical protein|nr:hypothetical protein [Actinomycetota bacterium]
MSTTRTSRIALVVPASLAVLSLAGCGGSSSGSNGLSSVPSVSPSAPSPTAASPTAAPSPTAPAVDQTIHITYANGKVTGVGTRVKVKSGSTVALVVTSDVADEVHFHGYNKMADVTKGGTVTIVFKATIPGVFEVELEKLKHRLVLLQIQ